MNKLLMEVLAQFNIPVRYMAYSGTETTYITFFTVNNYDDTFSDEKEEINVHSIQIDLWSLVDVTELKKEIKKALKSKFSEVTYRDLYELDTKKHHIAFRCYYYEEVL